MVSLRKASQVGFMIVLFSYLMVFCQLILVQSSCRADENAVYYMRRVNFPEDSRKTIKCVVRLQRYRRI